MKTVYFSLFVIFSLLLGGCAAKKVTTAQKSRQAPLDLSKIHYPTTIGSYEFESKKDFKNKSLGTLIRYIDTKKTKAYLDCYLYPQTQDSNLSSQYNELKSTLFFMAKSGEFKKFKTLKEDKINLDATHQAFRGIYDIENKNLPFYSVAYLATLKDHYFKVRISNPHKASFLSSDFGEAAVRELYKKINFDKSK